MIELFTTIPTRLIRPTKAKKENDHPVMKSAMNEPLIAKGIAEKIISGCLILLNCNTKTAKINIRATNKSVPRSPKLSDCDSYSPPT